MYNRETLVEALAVIIEVCKNFEDCYYCPMFSDDYQACLMMKEGPEEWDFPSNMPPWRAIK